MHTRFTPVLFLAGFLFLLLIMLTAPALAWTTVGNGIEYQEFTVTGPNNVFVARMDRNNTTASIESMFPYGKVSGGVQTVKNQAANYDDAINYWGQTWGQRNDIIVAVNGDFWNVDTQIPVGGQIQSGWYAKQFWDYGSDSGFAWSLGRVPFIGECVHHIPDKNFITFTATGNTMKFKGINRSRGTDELVIYTPHYDSTTKTDNTGVEVVVEMTRPMLILPSPNMAKGYVRQIRQNAGSTPIPFDCIVLSASGSTASTLLSKAVIGAEVGVTQEITSFYTDCTTPLPVDWTKAYASVGGNFTYLRDGNIMPTTDAGLTNRAPRTAVGYNASYVYFIVVDGRDPGISVGMSMTELANFCLTYLQATHGINQDGGGSSTMVVNGVVKNKPSDGSERAVSNGIAIINVMPKLQSTVFTAGQLVVTNNTANVRLGPGTNYATLNTVSSGVQGTIIAHALKGVYAKGYYWWKVDFNGVTGWVAESLLNAGGSPPVINQHPQPVVTCVGQTAGFTVSAGGAGTLSYQWQKNGTNVSNGEHYSGVTTPTLSVLNVTQNEVGGYRCVVTNAYGSATSNSASLSLNQTPPAPVAVTDEGTYTPSLTTLKASWTTAVDACDQPINRYEYAVGTASNLQDVRGWTSAGTSTSTVISSLSLVEDSTYYIQVRSVDNSGLASSGASSNGITAARGVTWIGSMWALPNSTGRSLRNKVVTAVDGSTFWLEELDRSAAVKVISSTVVAKGNKVNVAGVLGASGTQRALMGDVVETSGSSPQMPAPVVMPQRDLGGESPNGLTPGVTGSSSLYNIGMLVRCFGTVTYSDSTNPLDRYFYFDDGSELSDGGTYAGVKVRCGSLPPPPTYARVLVTGIVSSEQMASLVAPVILVFDSSDLVSL